MPLCARDAQRPLVPGSVRSFHRDWMRDYAQVCGRAGRDSEAEAEPSEVAVPEDDAGAPWRLRTGQEIAAFTSSASFFSTMGLHFLSAYDTGHTSPSSRFAASWKPRVE
jgi:hypothetical protein